MLSREPEVCLRILANNTIAIVQKYANEWAAARELLAPKMCIIDVKYMDEADMFRPISEAWVFKKDLRKQFTYEKVLQSMALGIKIIESEFWLPTAGESRLVKETYPSVFSHIGVRLINFHEAAKAYISPI